MNPVTGWINKADDKLKVVELFFDREFYGSAITTSYMLMFSAAKALLLLKEINCSTHEGLIYLFKINYVDNGLFPKRLFKTMCKNKELRTAYLNFAKIDYDKCMAEEYLNYSREFLKTTKELLNELI